MSAFVHARVFLCVCVHIVCVSMFEYIHVFIYDYAYVPFSRNDNLHVFCRHTFLSPTS